MKSIAAVISVGVLALGLAACGDDDDGGGGGSGSADAEREEIVSALSGEGFDEACIRENVDDLNDEDARLLSANLDSEEIPDDAGASALAFIEALFECFDLGDLDFGDIGDIGSGGEDE